MQVNVQQQFVPYHDLRPGQNVGPPQQMAQYGPQWGPWFAPEQPAQPPPPPRLPQQPPNPPPQGLGVNQQQQQRDQQLQLLNRVARGRPPAGARPTGPSGVALTAPPPPGQPMLTGNTHIATRIQNPQSNYGWAIQNAPPVNAVPPLDIQISLMEICTFFPCWFLVPDVSSDQFLIENLINADESLGYHARNPQRMDSQRHRQSHASCPEPPQPSQSKDCRESHPEADL